MDNEEKNINIKEDDEDLDGFEEQFDELFEETYEREKENVKEAVRQTIKEKAKKEEENKINWKKILPYVGVGVVCFLLGKKRQRFVPIKKGIEFVIPGSENWSHDEYRVIEKYINARNEAMLNNNIVVCTDKKKKLVCCDSKAYD